MAMSSGLEFNEDYGDVTDVTSMLYLKPDMAAFAAAKPLAGETGGVFSYSSGTPLVLSRLWQERVGSDAPSWPRTKLFAPIGMTSAVMEMDARGTFVGSSYLYATARDWARFGQFLLQDGVWNGKAILPSGFVAWMREAAPASNGTYGRGLLWLRGPEGGLPDNVDPDAGFDLPEDTYWLEGHDGQSVAVIPSKNLVVVRMGLTPSKLGYRPQALVGAVAKLAED
jgi:CubicO group peptidase (beta-lactamase class C family)